MGKELDTVLKRSKSRKTASLDNVPPEVWKIKNLMTFFFDYVTKQNNRGINRRKAISESLRTTET